jgi:5'-3' exonuclease
MIEIISVADPGCLSRIPDSDFFVHPESRISDPGSRTKISNKSEGEKKFVVGTFFVAINVSKFSTYLIFELAKKKVWANLQRIIELFIQKVVTNL